jgi:hypothetical protein
MDNQRVFAYTFAKIYQLYVQKAERKKRSQAEVDQILRWLTGYTAKGLQKQIDQEHDLGTFLDEAPKWNPKSELITGTICGVKIAEIDDPRTKKMRQMDKVIDELAKGRAMEKILRE